MTSRQSALKILDRCFKERAWSSQTIDSLICDLDDREKALASKLALGVLQNYMMLDLIIDRYCKKLDLTVRNILRIGTYQLLYLDKIPNYAAINECVDLAKSNGYKSASGLINAVLRKISADKIPEDVPIYIKYSHPKWFADKMTDIYGIEFTKKLLEANNSEPEINYHKGFTDEMYVQDNAAYRAVEMLELKPGMRILDACSAPGGKSFTAAMLMNNSGEIISCDIHQKKLKLIEEGAARLGIDIISTRCMDASVYNEDFAGAFDAVIADVPCSGFGVIRKKPDIRFKSEEEILPLPEKQSKILANLSKYVKNGGKLLYSTCTVLPEENEQITSEYNVIKQKTFFPNIDGTDGFYAAVISL